MAVKIRLKRLGKIRSPHYRVVVADSRAKRDGRVIEEIGIYHPVQNPSRIEINSERAQYWLGVGAQPTEQVLVLLKLTGDWARFKGDKDAVSSVQVAEPPVAFVPKEAKQPVLKLKEDKKSSAKKAEPEAPADEPAREDASEAQNGE